jgi:hypothetical protein
LFSYPKAPLDMQASFPQLSRIFFFFFFCCHLFSFCRPPRPHPPHLRNLQTLSPSSC